MKIVHLLPSIDFGGTERILLTLANHQQLAGHDVYVITFTKNNGYPRLTSKLKIIILENVSVLWQWNKTKSTGLGKLHGKLKELNSDVVHSHSFWTDLMLYSLDKFNTVYVSHFHLNYDFYTKKKINSSFFGGTYLQYRLFKKYKQYQTRFICASKQVHCFYKKNMPSSLYSNLNVIENGIDLTLYESEESKSIDLRLLSVGRLSQEKNYLYLLEVAKELKNLGVSFDWSIAGDGEQKEVLQNRIIDLGLSDNVHLLGHIADIATLYNKNDLLIHTSYKETFGLVFVEGMACGLPSISFMAGGNEEVIEHDVNGVLLNPSLSPKSFSNKIIQLYNDKGKYVQMQKKCIELAKRFSFEDYAKKVFDIYCFTLK